MMKTAPLHKTPPLKIALLTGGSTPERTVALSGACQVVEALRARDHHVNVVDTCSGVIPEDLEREILEAAVGAAPPSLGELQVLAGQEQLNQIVALPAVQSADVVFLVLHGRQGEGGAIQTLLELEGLTFTGSDSVGSTLAMDKDVSKRLMRQAGIPTPDWTCWPTVKDLGLPMVVKPSRVGSTVGLSIVQDLQDLDRAVEFALQYDQEVLLEEFVPGRELTVGVLDDQPLEVGEIVSANEIFDFEAKYTPGLAKEVFPAPDLSEELVKALKATAVQVHETLKLRHFSRVDFRLRPDGKFFCLEANTLPGMTKTSLLPQSALASGLSFEELCDRMVGLASAE